MSPVIVLGTSGHARVCIDVMHAAGFEVGGCVGGPPAGSLQVPYLGDDSVLAGLAEPGCRAFVAVGDNRTRQRLSGAVASFGFTLVQAVHPLAVVAPSADVGSNVVIVAGAVVNPFVRIGEGAIINTASSVDHDCTIGAYAHIAPGVHLAGDVEVGEGAFVGVGASVIPGRRIGAWATVGAGSVVVRDVGPDATVYGVPARVRTREHR